MGDEHKSEISGAFRGLDVFSSLGNSIFPIIFSPWRHAPQPFYYNSPMRILNLLELFYLLRILQHPRWFYQGIHIAFGSFREGEHFLKLFPNSTLPVFRAV